MADPCCDDIIGGEIYITANIPKKGFYRYEAIGEVRLQPSRLERTAGASSGGTVWVTEASRPIRAILSYVNRCNYDPMELWRGRCKIAITVVEQSRGYIHYLVNALIVGMPEINFATGEVSGMEIVCDEYYYTSSSFAQEGPGFIQPGAGVPT